MNVNVIEIILWENILLGLFMQKKYDNFLQIFQAKTQITPKCKI